jgi:hypothetical protein
VVHDLCMPCEHEAPKSVSSNQYRFQRKDIKKLRQCLMPVSLSRQSEERYSSQDPWSIEVCYEESRPTCSLLKNLKFER